MSRDPEGFEDPRSPEQQDYTGTGTSRSDDQGMRETGVAAGGDVGVDPAVSVGANTSSHPAAADDVTINRSGGGGTGGPSADAPDMTELLGGDPGEGTDS